MHIQHIQKVEKLQVHIDEHLRGLVRPFLVKQDVMVKNFVFHAAEHRVEPPGMEDRVGIGERCLVKTP